MYRGKIVYPHMTLSEIFPTVGTAEQWLDSQNNNAEYTTIIEELDANGNVSDWFYYTEKKT